MKYQVYKNFLPVDFFKKLKNLIIDQDFPWRRTTHSKDKIYFTHCFYNTMNAKSNLYEPYILPILKKLDSAAPIQIRANLFISALFKTSDWHIDYDFKCRTAILYLNDCDGGTELKINNKIKFIKADAYKMLVFDTPVFHRALTSKEEPLRYVINFNYF